MSAAGLGRVKTFDPWHICLIQCGLQQSASRFRYFSSIALFVRFCSGKSALGIQQPDQNRPHHPPHARITLANMPMANMLCLVQAQMAIGHYIDGLCDPRHASACFQNGGIHRWAINHGYALKPSWQQYSKTLSIKTREVQVDTS